MVLDKDSGKSKFAPRANEGIFVGYPHDRKGYRIWMLNSHQIIHARDVKFFDEARHKMYPAKFLSQVMTFQ